MFLVPIHCVYTSLAAIVEQNNIWLPKDSDADEDIEVSCKSLNDETELAKNGKIKLSVWAEHFSKPEKERKDFLTKIFEKEYKFLKSLYCFLENDQVLGKTFTKFGIPNICGKIDKKFFKLASKRSNKVNKYERRSKTYPCTYRKTLYSESCRSRGKNSLARRYPPVIEKGSNVSSTEFKSIKKSQTTHNDISNKKLKESDEIATNVHLAREITPRMIEEKFQTVINDLKPKTTFVDEQKGLLQTIDSIPSTKKSVRFNDDKLCSFAPTPEILESSSREFSNSDPISEQISISEPSSRKMFPNNDNTSDCPPFEIEIAQKSLSDHESNSTLSENNKSIEVDFQIEPYENKNIVIEDFTESCSDGKNEEEPTLILNQPEQGTFGATTENMSGFTDHKNKEINIEKVPQPYIHDLNASKVANTENLELEHSDILSNKELETNILNDKNIFNDYQSSKSNVGLYVEVPVKFNQKSQGDADKSVGLCSNRHWILSSASLKLHKNIKECPTIVDQSSSQEKGLTNQLKNNVHITVNEDIVVPETPSSDGTTSIKQDLPQEKGLTNQLKYNVHITVNEDIVVPETPSSDGTTSLKQDSPNLSRLNGYETVAQSVSKKPSIPMKSINPTDTKEVDVKTHLSFEITESDTLPKMDNPTDSKFQKEENLNDCCDDEFFPLSPSPPQDCNNLVRSSLTDVGGSENLTSINEKIIFLEKQNITKNEEADMEDSSVNDFCPKNKPVDTTSNSFEMLSPCNSLSGRDYISNSSQNDDEEQQTLEKITSCVENDVPNNINGSITTEDVGMNETTNICRKEDQIINSTHDQHASCEFTLCPMSHKESSRLREETSQSIHSFTPKIDQQSINGDVSKEHEVLLANAPSKTKVIISDVLTINKFQENASQDKETNEVALDKHRGLKALNPINPFDSGNKVRKILFPSKLDKYPLFFSTKSLKVVSRKDQKAIKGTEISEVECFEEDEEKHCSCFDFNLKGEGCVNCLKKVNKDVEFEDGNIVSGAEKNYGDLHYFIQNENKENISQRDEYELILSENHPEGKENELSFIVESSDDDLETNSTKKKTQDLEIENHSCSEKNKTLSDTKMKGLNKGHPFPLTVNKTESDKLKITDLFEENHPFDSQQHEKPNCDIKIGVNTELKESNNLFDYQNSDLINYYFNSNKSRHLREKITDDHSQKSMKSNQTPMRLIDDENEEQIVQTSETAHALENYKNEEQVVQISAKADALENYKNEEQVVQISEKADALENYKNEEQVVQISAKADALENYKNEEQVVQISEKAGALENYKNEEQVVQISEKADALENYEKEEQVVQIREKADALENYENEEQVVQISEKADALENYEKEEQVVQISENSKALENDTVSNEAENQTHVPSSSVISSKSLKRILGKTNKHEITEHPEEKEDTINIRSNLNIKEDKVGLENMKIISTNKKEYETLKPTKGIEVKSKRREKGEVNEIMENENMRQGVEACEKESASVQMKENETISANDCIKVVSSSPVRQQRQISQNLKSHSKVKNYIKGKKIQNIKLTPKNKIKIKTTKKSNKVNNENQEEIFHDKGFGNIYQIDHNEDFQSLTSPEHMIDTNTVKQPVAVSPNSRSLIDDFKIDSIVKTKCGNFKTISSIIVNQEITNCELDDNIADVSSQHLNFTNESKDNSKLQIQSGQERDRSLEFPVRKTNSFNSNRLLINGNKEAHSSNEKGLKECSKTVQRSIDNIEHNQNDSSMNKILKAHEKTNSKGIVLQSNKLNKHNKQKQITNLQSKKICIKRQHSQLDECKKPFLLISNKIPVIHSLNTQNNIGSAEIVSESQTLNPIKSKVKEERKRQVLISNGSVHKQNHTPKLDIARKKFNVKKTESTVSGRNELRGNNNLLVLKSENSLTLKKMNNVEQDPGIVNYKSPRERNESKPSEVLSSVEDISFDQNLCHNQNQQWRSNKLGTVHYSNHLDKKIAHQSRINYNSFSTTRIPKSRYKSSKEEDEEQYRHPLIESPIRRSTHNQNWRDENCDKSKHSITSLTDGNRKHFITYTSSSKIMKENVTEARDKHNYLIEIDSENELYNFNKNTRNLGTLPNMYGNEDKVQALLTSGSESIEDLSGSIICTKGNFSPQSIITSDEEQNQFKTKNFKRKFVENVDSCESDDLEFKARPNKFSRNVVHSSSPNRISLYAESISSFEGVPPYMSDLYKKLDDEKLESNEATLQRDHIVRKSPDDFSVPSLSDGFNNEFHISSPQYDEENCTLHNSRAMTEHISTRITDSPFPSFSDGSNNEFHILSPQYDKENGTLHDIRAMTEHTSARITDSPFPSFSDGPNHEYHISSPQYDEENGTLHNSRAMIEHITTRTDSPFPSFSDPIQTDNSLSSPCPEDYECLNSPAYDNIGLSSGDDRNNY